MLKVLIVDDEIKARRVLENILQEYCSQETNIVASVDDVPNAVKAIHKFKPDLVLLDIEMPNHSGFDLLDFFETIDFDIIFTTAYQEYAVQAFQVATIDYLLKPIQIDLLINAIEKVSKNQGRQRQEKLDTFKNNLQEDFIKKIALPTSEGLMFVEIEQIMMLIADGSYTHVFLEKQDKILVSNKLKSFEQVLQHPFFFRTHRSYIINLNRVKRYVRQDGGYIVMENGEVASLARDKKEGFLKLYQVPR